MSPTPTPAETPAPEVLSDQWLRMFRACAERGVRIDDVQLLEIVDSYEALRALVADHEAEIARLRSENARLARLAQTWKDVIAQADPNKRIEDFR